MEMKVTKEMQEMMKENEEKLNKAADIGQMLYIVAIYDKRAEQYAMINTAPNLASAVRGFTDACKDEKSALFNYAEDFKLVLLGKMNQKTGQIFQKECYETLLEAKTVVVKNK